MGLSVVSRASACRSIFLALTVIASTLSSADSAIAVPVSAREVRLKTYAGTPCILGVKIAYPIARGTSAARVGVEVKERGKWRRARRDPILRSRRTKTGRIAFHQPTKKFGFRYFLADRSGRKLSRPAVVRLSGLPLCPGVRDIDADLIDQRDKGVVPPVPTPTGPGANSDTPPVCASLDQLLASWGRSGPCDLDGSGSVDGGDLGLMLSRG